MGGRADHSSAGGTFGDGLGPRASGFGGLPGSGTASGVGRRQRLISSDERDSDQVTMPLAQAIAQNAKKASE